MPIISSFGALTYNKANRTNLPPFYRWFMDDANKATIPSQTSSDFIVYANKGKSQTIVTNSNHDVIIAGTNSRTGYVYTDGYLVGLTQAGIVNYQNYVSDINDGINDAIIDSSNNIYVVGWGNNTNCTLIKYNSSGSIVWQKKITTTSTCYGYKLRLDVSDNIYVLGVVYSTNNPLTTSLSSFVMKINSSGTILWQKNQTYGNQQNNIDYELDSSNCSYIITRNNLFKYDSAGTLTYNLKYNGPTVPPLGTQLWSVFSYSIAMDSDNSCFYVLGNATITSTPNNQYDFIAKHNLDGSIVWWRYIGSGEFPGTYNTFKTVKIVGDSLILVSGHGLTGTGPYYTMIYSMDIATGNIGYARKLASTGTDLFAITNCHIDENSLYLVGIDGSDSIAFKFSIDGAIPGTGSYTSGGKTINYTSETIPTVTSQTFTTVSSSITTGTSSLSISNGTLVQNTSTNTITVTQI